VIFRFKALSVLNGFIYILCYFVRMKMLLSFWRNQSGATAIEYGLIVAGIAVSLAASLFLFGDSIGPVYDAMSGFIQTFDATVPDAVPQSQ